MTHTQPTTAERARRQTRSRSNPRLSAFIRGIFFSLLVVARLGVAVLAADKASEPKKPIVVVFDFSSAYDGGAVGRTVARNLWAKLDRSGRCILVAQDDVAEAVREAKFTAGFDAKQGDLLRFAAEKLEATSVIWGKVEQAGAEGLKVFARAAATDRPDVLSVDTDIEVKNHYELQAATNEVVRLFFELPLPKPEIGMAEEKAWQTGPNLVKNGSFEEGKGHPAAWEPFDKSYHQGGVSWVDSPEGKGKCIRFSLTEAVAAGPGAAYYSDPVSVKDGTVYRVSVRVRSDGPAVKVFLKHYKQLPPGPNEKEGQWRETRRAHMNCVGEKGQWQDFTMDFHPHRGDQFDPEVTRVELYAYWPKGVVYFDDVVLKKLK